MKWAIFVLAWTLMGTVAAFAVAYVIWVLGGESFAPREVNFLVEAVILMGAIAGLITGVIVGARRNEKWR